MKNRIICPFDGYNLQKSNYNNTYMCPQCIIKYNNSNANANYDDLYFTFVPYENDPLNLMATEMFFGIKNKINIEYFSTHATISLDEIPTIPVNLPNPRTKGFNTILTSKSPPYKFTKLYPNTIPELIDFNHFKRIVKIGAVTNSVQDYFKFEN